MLFVVILTADVHRQTLSGKKKKNPVVKESVALVPTFYNTSEASICLNTTVLVWLVISVVLY